MTRLVQGRLRSKERKHLPLGPLLVALFGEPMTLLGCGILCGKCVTEGGLSQGSLVPLPVHPLCFLFVVEGTTFQLPALAASRHPYSAVTDCPSGTMAQNNLFLL